MPLVLTTNDVVRNPDHAWNDIPRVQPAEYFGRARVGDLRMHPDTNGDSRPRWFCAIEDYQPFNPPVPANIDDQLIEQIPSNLWRNGVRDLDEVTFRRHRGKCGE